MSTAMNTMNQLQKQFDIISHNISNVQTTGFKSRDASFTDLLAQEMYNQSSPEKEVGRLSPFGIRQGVGAKIANSSLNPTQGAVKMTDRSLDLAFTKPNQYLKVQVQTGAGTEVQFTRNGALYVTQTDHENLMLVTQDGHAVLDANDRPIIFSNQLDEYNVTDYGSFQAKGATGQSQEFNLGVISLHKPQFMEQKGDSLIGLPQNVPVDQGTIFTNLTTLAERNNIGLQQGALEGSNVDLSKEMTNMLMVQRALQFQSKAITLSDQMLGIVNNIR